MDDESGEEEQSEYLTQTDDDALPKPDPPEKAADEKEDSPLESNESMEDDADVETGE
jgi:hypothetical protein